MSADHDILMMR